MATARARARKAAKINSSASTVAVKATPVLSARSRNLHSVDEGEDCEEGGDEGGDSHEELEAEKADVGGWFAIAVNIIGAVSASAKFDIIVIGIDSCAAASVMLEREPSSFPCIPKRTVGRNNTFYTASKQSIQESALKVISGNSSGCASRSLETEEQIKIQIHVTDMTLDGGKQSAGTNLVSPVKRGCLLCLVDGAMAEDCGAAIGVAHAVGEQDEVQSVRVR